MLNPSVSIPYTLGLNVKPTPTYSVHHLAVNLILHTREVSISVPKESRFSFPQSLSITVITKM